MQELGYFSRVNISVFENSHDVPGSYGAKWYLLGGT